MIAAIVLAAGLSTRMGTQKMLLPWGKTTVIGKVLDTLGEAGISEIRLVTGGTHAELGRLLQESNVKLVFNKDFANGEMLTSAKVGLRELGDAVEAILVVLGDQPQIEASVIIKITEHFDATHHPIIVPSYKMHRGHPWLLGKAYWQEVLALEPPLTLRDFLDDHQDLIDYVNVESPSILLDLDTRQDYDRFKS